MRSDKGSSDGWKLMFGTPKDSKWRACLGMGVSGFLSIAMIKAPGAFTSFVKKRVAVLWTRATTHISGSVKQTLTRS